MKRIKCYESSYQPLDEDLDRWGDNKTSNKIKKHLPGLPCLVSCCFQGSVLHQDHGRGPSLPGQPRPWSHPEPNRLLPDEHPHYAAFHLPVSPWWKRPQHQGADWRRFRLVFQRKRGVWPFKSCGDLNDSVLIVFSLPLSSLPKVWGNSSRSRTSEIWKCGQARWREPSRRRRAWGCGTSSGNLSMK